MDNALYLLPLLLIIVMVLIIGLPYLLDYILKRRIKPNEEYLDEIKYLKTVKVTSMISLLIFISIIPLQSLGINSYLWLIVAFLVESVKIKTSLNFLENKEDSESTKKYLIIPHIILFLVIIASLLFMYFIYQK